MYNITNQNNGFGISDDYVLREVDSRILNPVALSLRLWDDNLEGALTLTVEGVSLKDFLAESAFHLKRQQDGLIYLINRYEATIFTFGDDGSIEKEKVKEFHHSMSEAADAAFAILSRCEKHPHMVVLYDHHTGASYIINRP